MNYRIFVCCCFLSITSAFVWAAEPQNASIEPLLMQRLARVQLQSQNQLSEFITDGCSGGLSSGWKWMADNFPRVKEKWSERPWWEDCCVAHDIVYWQGETNDGVELRRQADERLRECVVAKGPELANDLSRRLNITPKEVGQAFVVVGNLMYDAVRTGGLPCTRLPWRWGYGWPHCE